MRCWGDNRFGQLGYGHTHTIGDDERPWTAGDVPVGAAVTQIAVGAFHACAVLSSGPVRCWGRNNTGAVGSGNPDTIGDDEPASSGGDVSVGGSVAEITAGGDHSCALLTNGKVRCWGLNYFGALGCGHAENIGDDEPPSTAGDVAVH